MILPRVAAAFEPEDINIVVAVLAGVAAPVIAIVIPLIEKDPVGEMNGVILALLTVTEDVVDKSELPIILPTEAVVWALVNEPLTTLVTNNVSPPFAK